MITGKHSYIRGTEYDDVEALATLYQPGALRAGLLDARREPLMPSLDDLRELLGRKEIADGAFYTVEDRQGHIRGFASLRGMNPEARYCEFSLLFLEPLTYVEPLADEAADILLDRAYCRLGLHKVLAYCLPNEQEFAAFLRRQGFESAGVQREILYAQGQWHNLETFARTGPMPTSH